MSLTLKTPLGIINNNPGNLREGFGLTYKTPKSNGFAQFKTMTDGCQSLAALVYSYYQFHGLKTIGAFVSRYAPASENDVLAYSNAIADFLRIDRSKIDTYDLRLTFPWRAFHLIEAIIRVECGAAPDEIPTAPNWVRIEDIVTGMQRSNRWVGVV